MRLSLRYVKASLLYLVTGATLMLLSFARFLPFEMTAFYFMQLYGFVAMMIFGLSYLFVPSFAHGFLHSLKMANMQFWLMNIGVIGLTVAFSGLLPYNPDTKILVIGTLLVQVAALYLHAYNMWRTLRAWKRSPGERLARETAAAKT
jgi:cbb3-type cytochrome oxidase subunit 1